MKAQSYFRSLLIAVCLSTNSHVFSQTSMLEKNSKNRLSFGVTAGHYQYDPALGIEITSPSFFSNNLRLRMKANYTWMEHYKAVNNHWATFPSYWLGLLYNGNPFRRGRIFFEAGSCVISPNKVYSSEKLHAGYYGSIGVEFCVDPNQTKNIAYFVSGGFAFIHAHADKMTDQPQYGQGIIFSNGFRYYF